MPAVRTIETPVLIIGGGPVGLALANELGMRNVPCVVVEQFSGTTQHPKASALNARSMEFMRRWGIADEVLAASAPPDFPHTLFFCTSLSGHEIMRVERPHHGGVGPAQDSPERPQRCNQLWLDPILQKRAQAYPAVTILYQHRFETLEQDDQQVIAHVHDVENDEDIRIVATDVADCSGGHSPCRRQFGIGMSGSDYIGYHVSVLLRAPKLWDYHDKGAAALIHFVDARGAWRNFVALDGRELYRFGINGKEYYDNPDAIDLEHHFRAVTGTDIPHEFLSVKPWTARNVVADHYTIGRVHLAGDAAHLNHPAAGLGLNTGLGDAVGLGWKLAAVLAGWGGPGLLQNYETERRAIGLRNVGHANVSNDGVRRAAPDPHIAEDSPAGEAARQAMRERLQEGQKRKVITDGIALGYRYQSPLICADAGPVPEDSVTTYTPSTYPGCRAPHIFLDDGRSTLDLFGDGFVLLDFDYGQGHDAGQSMRSAFEQRRVPLTCHVVADDKAAELYERKLVLVRPDGHVAWRGDQVPDDPLAIADQVRGA